MTFLRGEADVLVCTSIIESGIDIPQANTLIVERADVFGLAQLYQIRGRVGRSRERAYSYMLYPSAAALTPDAATRLTALSDYTELGAGVKIALRDLEIRGAGNLLGDEQSGHVAALGFELYLRMLDEAVARLGAEQEGEELPEPVRLDVNVDAYVPADYIPYEEAKIDVHRRIAGARDVADLELLRDELEDRFGPPPVPLHEPDRPPDRPDQARRRRARRAVTFRATASRSRRSSSTRSARGIREAGAGRALRVRARSQLSLRVPAEPAERFPAVVRAADVLLRSRARRLSRAPSRGRTPPRGRPGPGATGAVATIAARMSRPLRILPALGAVFLVAVAVAACGATACPATPWRGSQDDTITKKDFEKWMLVAAMASQQQVPGGQGDRSGRPGLQGLHRRRAQGRAGAGQGPAQPTDAQFKTQCQTAVRRPQGSGHVQFLISVRVDRGRGDGPRHQA